MRELKITKLKEVVIAVNNAEPAAAFFKDIFNLNFDIEWSMPNESMNVKAAYIGDTQLHIVESTKRDGIIAKSIESRGQGLHHIAFEVENLVDWIHKLKEKGVKLIPEEPIVYSQGRYIFIHPKSAYGVLIELIKYKT